MVTIIKRSTSTRPPSGWKGQCILRGQHELKPNEIHVAYFKGVVHRLKVKIGAKLMNSLFLTHIQGFLKLLHRLQGNNSRT